MKEQKDNLNKAVNALKSESRPIGPPQETIDATLAKLVELAGESHTEPVKNRITITERIKAMKSFTKLATAAVIIIAAVLSITLFDKAVAPAYGITDVPELLRSARTLHIKAWSYFPEDTSPGKVQRRVALEDWFDLENGKVKTMSAGYNNVPMNTSLVLVEKVFDGQYKMIVNHSKKTVTFERLSPFQQELFTYQNIRGSFRRMLGDPERLDEFSRVGEEVIDGISYDIWQGQVKNPYWHHSQKVKSWVAPQTGELARVCIWTGRDKAYETEQVQRDIDIPAEVFATEPPPGYELINTKDSAEIPELKCGLTGYQKADSVTWRIGFTMPDGSVILTWHSESTQRNVSQAPIFESLEPGGALPKLPIEIYALMSIGASEAVTYEGRHLLHTIKNGRFCEWSIYVPAQRAPDRSDFLGYQTVPRFNPPQDKATFSLPMYNDLLIENEEQFNKWVLGAMAELSDDGKAPEDITYEAVLQLAEQIRESLAQ